MKLDIGMVRCQTDAEIRRLNRLGTLCNLIDCYPKLDILLAPEWYFIPVEGGMHSADSFQTLKKILEITTSGKEMLLIPGTIAWLERENNNNVSASKRKWSSSKSKEFYRNTALVISNGKTILSYSKRTEGGDYNFARRYGVEWQPGEESGGFYWRKLKCGLEICADHGENCLRRDGFNDLDLQIVVACGASLDENSLAVRNGGQVLLCDGCKRFGGPDFKCQAKGYNQNILVEQELLRETTVDPDQNVMFRQFQIEI